MFKLKVLQLLPYFLLAVAVIIAYNAIGELGTIFNFIGNIIGRIWSIITPFFYGFILAYILHMPFEAIQRLLGKCKFKFIQKRKKAFSLILMLLLVVLIIFALSYLIIPTVSNSILHFIENLPSYYEAALAWIERLNEMDIFSNFDLSTEGIIEMIEEWLHGFSLEYLSSGINALMGISSAVFGVGTAILTGFLAFISSIYFLVEKDKIKYFMCRLLVIFTPLKVRDIIIKYGGELDHNFKQYIRVQTVDGLILGTLATIQLAIMGSPFALVLGIMLGIVNYIPYFGSIFGTLIAVIVVAFTQGIQMGLIAAALLLVTQQLDANVIQPKLMGGSFKLSPLLVIISITVGGATAGIFGMIIAIPIVKVLTDIIGDIVAHYENSKAEKSPAKAADTNTADETHEHETEET